MTALLLLGYAAVCVVIFKLLRVPINKWTVTTAGLGGAVAVGGLLLAVDYNHPFTTDGRLFFITTSVAPTVSGHVNEVAVKSNVPVKAGDLLFQIDPRPYQYVVDQRKALLAEAEQGVLQLRASFEQTSAAVEKARADMELAQLTYDRQVQLLERNVVAQTTLDTALRNLDGARQNVIGAQAAAERARLALTSEIGGINTAVARLQADLRSAEFNFSETSVRAPTNGYTTQLFVRPGMMASPMSPTMVFIHSDDNIFAASFAQSTLQRVRAGDEAEIAFDGIPGRVFKGKVNAVLDVIAQGQVQASGNLINVEDRKTAGRAIARIDITDDLSAHQLPAGSTAQVAVYTEHWRPVAVIRRVLLRMKSWLNYVI
jgi:multidrug resistance efflux pump